MNHKQKQARLARTRYHTLQGNRSPRASWHNPKTSSVVETQDRHPTTEQWDEMIAAAKRRKRKIDRFAEAQGFKLVGDDNRERTSWMKT